MRILPRFVAGVIGGVDDLSIRATIEATIVQVATEHKKVMPPLGDTLHLVDCGLDSLGLAVVVARLEESLGMDPFADAGDLTFPATVGDFIRLYENARK